MCYQNLTLLALFLGFAGTVILALIGVRGVSVKRNGSISLGGGGAPPTDPLKREKWAWRRYWAYRIGLPFGVLVILLSFVLQAFALYVPLCVSH